MYSRYFQPVAEDARAVEDQRIGEADDPGWPGAHHRESGTQAAGGGAEVGGLLADEGGAGVEQQQPLDGAEERAAARQVEARKEHRQRGDELDVAIGKGWRWVGGSRLSLEGGAAEDLQDERPAG